MLTAAVCRSFSDYSAILTSGFVDDFLFYIMGSVGQNQVIQPMADGDKEGTHREGC